MVAIQCFRQIKHEYVTRNYCQKVKNYLSTFLLTLQRDPEKMAKIENDIMEFCRKRRLSHDLRHIKVEKSSLADRRPSILDHMHHGDGIFLNPCMTTISQST